MSKTLILAESGFGKSTSIGADEEFGIIGLNPATSYVLSTTSKDLPFAGSRAKYQPAQLGTLYTGHRYISNDGYNIAKAIRELTPSPIIDIVIDDFNYIMQDYYMKQALKTGWDAPKKIGHFMGEIFDAMEQAHNKNFYVLAHFGDDKKMKTVGKMVSEYITPEGKFDVVLFGKQTFNENEKKVKKVYVTNYDGEFPAKSPRGMFPQLEILNDLGLVSQHVNAYYNGTQMPEIKEVEAVPAETQVPKTIEADVVGDVPNPPAVQDAAPPFTTTG